MLPSNARPEAVERIRFLVQSTEDPLALDGPNVVRNLSRSPKKISAVYVYDRKGSELFERQCATPEYYLRRAEAKLLNSYAADILELCGFPPIVELGAGTAQKTRTLLAEYARRGLRFDYFPIDVDSETLAESARALVQEFPGLFIHCLATTYQGGLRALPPCSRARLFMFLGSSIGNMQWREIEDLLSVLFDCGVHGDYLLLGADLDKAAAVIDRAYNDSAGYGPRSTLNMLDHLNSRYGGDFVMENFQYRSRYDTQTKRNDVHIESLIDQNVTLSALNFSVKFRASELIEAEVMWKFDPDELIAVLDRAGFSLARQWIEPVFRYGLFLLYRR